MILDEPIVHSTFLIDLIRSHASHPDIVLEIGTGPSSTPVLAGLCEELSLEFRTIDVSRARVTWAQHLLRGKKNMFALRAKGEEFLCHFVGQIAFAYLDSYEWVDPGDPDVHKYSPRFSKRESELVHLEQTMELVKHLRPGGLILLGDTWFLERKPPGSKYLRVKVNFRKIPNKQIFEEYEVFGKGSLALPFLLCSGFGVLAVSERPHPAQVLLKKREPPSFDEALPYDVAYFTALLHEHRLVTYPVRGEFRAWLSTIWREDLKPYVQYLRSAVRPRKPLKRLIRLLGLRP